MNKPVRCTALLLLPFLLSSCSSKLFSGKKSKKKVGTTVAKTDSVHVIGTMAPVPTVATNEAPKAKLIAAVTPLWKARMQYRTFTGKAKVDLEGPNGSVGFSANFRIAKDSLVWVHVSALGGLYPVARILVTRDSFFMLNYDQKVATVLPVSDAAKVLPVAVRFAQLQGLFTGEPLADGNISGVEDRDSLWALEVQDASFVQHVTFRKADSALVYTHLQMQQPNSPTAMLNYSNHELVDGRRVSKYRTVRVQKDASSYLVDMDLVNLEFNKQLEFPFSIPKNFTVKKQ